MFLGLPGAYESLGDLVKMQLCFSRSGDGAGGVVGSDSISWFPASAASPWKILLRKEGRDGGRETEAYRG